MTILQALFLGTIQGLTEFLPVSSSGHLVFLPTLFGWEDQGLAFDVIVHLGSLTAVVIYFRQKLLELIKGFFSTGKKRQSERRLAWLIGLSIFPAGIIGYILDSNSRSTTVVAVSLIVWGIVLGIADHLAKKRKDQTSLDAVKPWQVAAISFAQAIALIPGTSRSGITMTAGLFTGLSKKAAAEFSFLMSVPIILIAGIVKVLEYIQDGGEQMAIGALLAGFLAAAVSGFIAIAGLMKLIQKWSFQPFMWYRIAVGILILLLL